MVTGILGIWLVGLILGFISLGKIKASNGKLGGKGMAITGIVASFFWLLVSLGLVVVAFPTFNNVRESGYQARNKSYAQQIILGCRVYASDNQGNFPDSLDDLYPDYINSKDIFLHKDINSNSERFVYYPGAATGQQRRIVVASPTPIKGELVVGYSDGVIEAIPENEFTAP